MGNIKSEQGCVVKAIPQRWKNGRIKYDQKRLPFDYAVEDVYKIRQAKAGLKCFEDARNPKSGYVLGILNLKGVLSDSEHDFGIKYMRLYYGYMKIEGFSFPFPRVLSLTENTASVSQEPDMSVKTVYLELKQYLSRVENKVLRDVVVLDEYPSPAWLDILKEALKKIEKYLLRIGKK